LNSGPLGKRVNDHSAGGCSARQDEARLALVGVA
jgi:hypothetical protein